MILPTRTHRSHTPPMPGIIRYAPGREEAERKALCRMNDSLTAENARLVKLMVWGISVSFVAGVVLGALCRRALVLPLLLLLTGCTSTTRVHVCARTLLWSAEVTLEREVQHGND